jgi:hypothetical protein
VTCRPQLLWKGFFGRERMSGMDENWTQRRGCSPLVIAPVTIVLPILYFLSSGPTYRLAEADYLDGKTYRAIYSPLVWLCHVSPSFNQVWKHYLTFCGA